MPSLRLFIAPPAPHYRGEIGLERRCQPVSIRRSALRALGTIGNRAAADAVGEALRDADVQVRIDAANALAKVGDHSHATPLYESWRKDESPQV
ncbi:MAG: HEAT repeat domain-containing protein, partial [Candidatus Competibacteraceae bacterium]|nr:HEAT repeat domain-containing protein [Candidatus Competibacteraceae bacterium]